uniref:Uncharacterized protein n=1 Tax=Cannabis sativa TaxID=3483 RepID=A0A803QC65_CANSA
MIVVRICGGKRKGVAGGLEERNRLGLVSAKREEGGMMTPRSTKLQQLCDLPPINTVNIRPSMSLGWPDPTFIGLAGHGSITGGQTLPFAGLASHEEVVDGQTLPLAGLASHEGAVGCQALPNVVLPSEGQQPSVCLVGQGQHLYQGMASQGLQINTRLADLHHTLIGNMIQGIVGPKPSDHELDQSRGSPFSAYINALPFPKFKKPVWKMYIGREGPLAHIKYFEMQLDLQKVTSDV